MTPTDEHDSAPDALRVLEDAHTIAVVGLSSNAAKYSHAVPAYLQSLGYKIVPVHPTALTLLGEPVLPSLADAQEPIDVVAVYRPSDEAEDITRQAVAIGARAVWLQEEVSSAPAARIAAAAGLAFLQDRCMGRVAAGLPGRSPSDVFSPGPASNAAHDAEQT